MSPLRPDALEAVVLAAGYGTRMGRLGRHLPKGLLPLGGRPLLDRLMERLAELDDVERVLLVTNHRFVEQFRSWRRNRTLPFHLHIVDDGTQLPQERLGAVADLALAVESADPGRPVLVTGSDNVFEFSFRGLVETFRQRPDAAAVVTVVAEEDRSRLEASGVPVIDGEGRVVRFHEKPDDPPAGVVTPPLYLFGSEALDDLRPYLDGEGNPDAPGHYLEWLVRRRPVYAWRAPGDRYDVGTPEQYVRVRKRIRRAPGA